MRAVSNYPSPVLVVAVLLVASLTSHASAESAQLVANAAPGLGTAEPFDMTSSFFRMVGGLLFCIGVFGAGIHVVKRYGGGAMTGTKRRLQVVERVPLSAKTSLVLVRLDGKELLLTAGPDRTSLIHAPDDGHKAFEMSLDRYVLPEEKMTCVG